MLLLKTWQIHKTSVRYGLKATCCVQLNIVLWDRVNLNFTEKFKSRYPKITAAMEKLLYFWVDKSHKRATNSTGIRANWTNCLLYILKVLLNLHNFPLLKINCTEPYLGLLCISYIMAQILNCKIPERVLLNGAICKRFHAGEDVRPVTSCKFLRWSNRVSIFEPYVCTLCHETHENTTDASDHAPQVAEYS